MDWLLWVVRAVLIAAGIIASIMVWKGKKKYYWGLFVIGIAAFIMGLILLIVSFITGLLSDFGLFLAVAGAIILIIALIVRSRSKKNH